MGKTVVTTSDCALNMPHTSSKLTIHYDQYDFSVLLGETSLGPVSYRSLLEAVQACDSLPIEDCRGISWDFSTHPWLRYYHLRRGTEPKNPEDVNPALGKVSKAWVRLPSVPGLTEANEYEIGAGLDNKAFKDVNEVTDNVQRLVSPLEGSQSVHIHPDVNLAVLKLNEPFEMSSKISTACLPAQDQVLRPSTPCYFAAW